MRDIAAEFAIRLTIVGVLAAAFVALGYAGARAGIIAGLLVFGAVLFGAAGIAAVVARRRHLRGMAQMPEALHEVFLDTLWRTTDEPVARGEIIVWRRGERRRHGFVYTCEGPGPHQVPICIGPRDLPRFADAGYVPDRDTAEALLAERIAQARARAEREVAAGERAAQTLAALGTLSQP